MPHTIYSWLWIDFPADSCWIELASVRQAAPLTTTTKTQKSCFFYFVKSGPNKWNIQQLVSVNYFNIIKSITIHLALHCLTLSQQDWALQTHFSTTSHHCVWLILGILGWCKCSGVICCNPSKSAAASQAPYLLNMAEYRSVKSMC